MKGLVKMARTEAQKQAQKDYMGKVKQVMVKFNTETEPDMVDWIGKKANMQGYIKSLIIEDMKRDVAKLPSMEETTSGTWTKLFELQMTPGQLVNSHERFKACRKQTDYIESEEELNELIGSGWATICRDGMIIWADM